MSWTGVGVIASVTPGTKVPLSATDVRCVGILVQALSNAGHTNTGKIYLYDRNNNRLATLAAPGTGSIPSISVTIPTSPSGMNLRDFSIDADNGTDGVDVSYIR